MIALIRGHRIVSDYTLNQSLSLVIDVLGHLFNFTCRDLGNFAKGLNSLAFGAKNLYLSRSALKKPQIINRPSVIYFYRPIR